ncbi:ATP-binding protein [Massilia agilis]|uniref:histidine kinase n=1 Tax=Massilia agilis TaxID=1811226 RepID=A0ABT2D4Z8_9BURK|nr:ATP-binding protein [Massilia agilis]
MNRPDQGHILFVCDRPVSDPVIETVSRELGQMLVRADSAESALAHLRNNEFALILAGYSGNTDKLLHAIRTFRATPRSSQTPVVVLGVPPDPGFPLEPLYEAGAIAVVTEPISPAILKAKARFYLDAFATATERRHAEAALLETSARLEATIEAAEVATWTWDVQADYVHADARMGALFAVPAAELDGAPLARWFAAIHPDDVAATRAQLDQAMREGATYDATFRLRAPGGWRWVIARGRVELDRHARALRLRGVIIDATRQIQAEQQLAASEERYRTLFESLDEGVCVIEVLFDAQQLPCDYRFLEVNPAFVAHTGLQDAVGKTIRTLAPAHEQHWFDIYGRVALTGEPVRFTHEARALGRWYDVYATRIGAPALRRVAVLFNDITERRHAEEELRRLAADLAESDRLKTEFLATLAHELRNPLAPIRSGLQLMRRAGSDAATMERVQAIMDRQLDHLVHLVDDLLDVARITRGQVELKREWIDLGQVLQGAVDASMPLVEASRHQLELALPAEPVPLFADPTRITQVVSNLLNNAAKYTPRGGHIALSARRDAAEAVITVADNGVGIPKAALADVFKMFTQVGAEDFRPHGGLGIGLSLVRSFVELHGGTVVASSKGPGAGSVFTVRLPLAPQGAPALSGAALPNAAQQSASALRVLVVDDNRDAAETLAALLDVMGHAAPVANDGAQALRMMHSFRPQVVFLDIGMPGMSGYEVASAIRRDHNFDNVMLVALTGWGGELDRSRSASAGFDEHLTKPATIEAIEQVLAKVAATAA